MQLTCLKRNRITFSYFLVILLKHNLPLSNFENRQNIVSAISYILKCITICLKHKTLPMYYLHQLNNSV